MANSERAAWAIGIRSQYRIDATFVFCQATGLFSYLHSPDSDNAYLCRKSNAPLPHGYS